MAVSGLTIYHNPRCSKSRATLALLEERGLQPTIVEYLNSPPDADDLAHILDLLEASPRELMRTQEAPYAEHNLDDDSLTSAALIEAMIVHPILIERPIVVNGDAARVGRPPEAVLEIL
ncbi:MAG: arsenate reductase (glutaredoxin) [Pseudomonadota bacterium]